MGVRERERVRAGVGASPMCGAARVGEKGDDPVVNMSQLHGILHGMHAGGTGCETGNLSQSPEFRVENWRLSSPVRNH